MLVIVDHPGYYSLQKTNSLSQDYSNLDDLLLLPCIFLIFSKVHVTCVVLVQLNYRS